jgi:hypothetical protein
LERGLGILSKTKVRVDYLLIGSSNASRLRTALEAKGRSVALVSLANFRLDRRNEGLLRVVREALLSSEPECVVLQLLDSSCFTARGPDGSRTLAKKLEDGKFHITGDVVICSRETQQEHFESLKPLLDLVEKKICLIITPMPRYITTGCCSDKTHVTNREEPNFKAKMLASLDDLRVHLKDFLFLNSKRFVKIVDPTYDMRSMADSEIWGDGDPIHLKPEMYAKLADGVIKLRQSALDKKEAMGSAQKRRRTDTAERDQDGHRDNWRPRAPDHYGFPHADNRGGACYGSGPRGGPGGPRGGEKGRFSFRGGRRGYRGWQH